MKKILFLCFLFFLSFKSLDVSGSSIVAARIGNEYYDTFLEAVSAAGSNDIITLARDISLDETLEINKTVNINLNNHEISASEKVFLVQGGSLNVRGKGTIKETNPYYGAIVIKGSTNPDDVDYSTVSVSEGVTLEGWSGIFIDNDDKKSYGVLVNMDGDINAVSDTDGGEGIGVYVNGYISDSNNSPVINLSDTVSIKSTGNGIYSAGYATYNINGAYIEGVQSGLGIKAGKFNIFDGTIKGTGDDETPTEGNNNGINASGVAIQMESNSGYAGNIELNIKNGTIESENSYVIYEYIVNNTSTQVKNISLSGGNYISNASLPVFSMSDSFNNNHKGFISGGSYSSSPEAYLKSGYTTSKNSNDMYEVISSAISVFALTNTSDSGGMPYVLICGVLTILGILIYLNREKILNLIKR